MFSAKNGDDGDDDNSFEIQIPRPPSRYGWLVFACRRKPKTGPFRNFGSEPEKLLRTLGGSTPFKDHPPPFANIKADGLDGGGIGIRQDGKGGKGGNAARAEKTARQQT